MRWPRFASGREMGQCEASLTFVVVMAWGAGIGVSIHNVRARDSYIRGSNGTSNGIVPMLRVFNDTGASWARIRLSLPVVCCWCLAPLTLACVLVQRATWTREAGNGRGRSPSTWSRGTPTSSTSLS
jgi:hypothetical protein